MNASDSTDNSVCLAPFRYSTIGVICQTELENILNSSNCPSDAENVFLVRNEEVKVTQLIAELTGIGASLECKRKVVKFIYLQLFGLCGGSGVFIQPSSNQCEDIRDTLNKKECSNISSILEQDFLDCAILPLKTLSCPTQYNGNPINRTII